MSDGAAWSAASYALTVNLTAQPKPPVLAGPAHAFTALVEDTPYTVTTAQLLEGFTDPNGGQTATLVVDALAATNAQVTDNGDGTWTITPYADYSGPLTLSYTVLDVDGIWAAHSVDLNVASVNAPPMPTGDGASLSNGTEGQPYTVTLAQLLQGFGDVGGTLAVTGLSVSNGAISTTDGGLTYTITPTAGYHGPVTISYDVGDGQGGSATTATTASFLLAPVNSAPTGPSTAVLPSGTEDKPLLIGLQDLLAGFSDPENDALSLVPGSLVATATDGSSAGAVTYNNDGTWTFTPAEGFHGTVSLGYQVTDGESVLTAGASFAVTEVVDVPPPPAGLGGTAVAQVISNQWSSVFTGDDPVSGVSGSNRVVVQTNQGYLRLPGDVSASTGVTIVTTGYGSPGYATTGTAQAIAFEGTQEQINAALRLLQISTPSAATVNVSLAEEAMAYNPGSGHFYAIGGTAGVGISWADAKTAAENSSYNGMKGYLATITSAAENSFILSKLPATGWIGASDAETEGTWRWVTGPEVGTTLSSGYTNWNGGEPNNSGNEDYAQFYVGGSTAGRWNDLPGTAANNVAYYVIEYGGQPGDMPTGNVTSTFSIGVRASNTDPIATGLTQDISYVENTGPVGLGDIVVTDVDASETVTAVLTVSHPTAGTLTTGTFGSSTSTYDAVTGVWKVTGTVASVNAALAAVEYTPAVDSEQSVTITTLIRDALNSGPASGTIAINVNPVNSHAPTGSSDSVTAREDTPLQLSVTDFGSFADADGGASQQFAAIRVATLPASGELQVRVGTDWVTVARTR